MPMRRPAPRSSGQQERLQQRLAEADARHQERIDEIDFNDAVRFLDNLALAERRGSSVKAAAFIERIGQYAIARSVEIRRHDCP